MLSIIASSIAGVVCFVVLDYVFLAQLAKDFYLKGLASHITIKDGSLAPYLPAVPLVYIVGIASIWILVLSRATDVRQAALHGAILGFLMYAFYDFTNLATLKEYPWSLAIVDILWGTFLIGAVSAIMFVVKDLFA